MRSHAPASFLVIVALAASEPAAAVGYDVSGAITQTAVDKVVSAPKYPLVVFDRMTPFQGLMAAGDRPFGIRMEGSSVDTPAEVLLGPAQTDDLLAKAAALVDRAPKRSIASLPTDEQLLRGLAAQGSEIVSEAQRLLADPSLSTRSPDIRKQLDEIATGGVAGLRKTLGAFPIKVHVARLALTVRAAPDIKLAVPTTSLDKIAVSIAATPELWVYHPVPKLDAPWNWPWKWSRVAVVTVSVPLDAAGQVSLAVEGTHILASASLSELKIPVPVIGLFNFAGLANLFLRDCKVDLYDASKLLVTVPVMDRGFTISGIAVRQPIGATGLEVLVETKAVPRPADRIASNPP